MSEWNLAYDFCAMVLMTLILVWFLTEKKIPLRSYWAYLVLVIFMLASTGLEITISNVAKYHLATGKEFLLILGFGELTTYILPLVMSWYMITMIPLRNVQHRRWGIALFTLGLIMSMCILINVETRHVFDYVGRIELHPLGMIFIMVDIIFVGVCFIMLARHTKDISFFRSMIVATNMIVCIAASYVQIKFNIPLLHFVLAICSLSLYHNLHNPGIMIDATTKVYNRNFMGEYTTHRFNGNKDFSVITIAMDDFKFINKTYGVEFGDQMLKQVGHFLAELDGYKRVFRYGSDQFCIIIFKEIDDMPIMAAKIIERFKHPWYGQENEYGIMMSASLCCIQCPRDAKDYESLVEIIDYSVVMAKKNKKGNITLASEMETGKLTKDKAIEKAVRQAMDRKDFMVYYQPIYSPATGTYDSAEALVRLKDEELGWISPDDFIPIAEKNGLIVELGELILEKVCRFIKESQLDHTTVQYIDVNISPLQLMQYDFVERVMAIMKEYGVSPKQINMEITETATTTSQKIVYENIRKLVEYGICFSLDDYGSGYANINYINQMPFHIIKLDKSLVWSAFENEKAEITLEYTIRMLNALNLEIVAEGVENEVMRDKLTEHGCKFLQGWYYSKAIPEEEFIQFIN